MDSHNHSYALSSFALAPATPQQASSTMPRRKPRKGHKKSRLGCFNCKRRKIKCQEVHPSCPNCIKSRTRCEYPNGPQEKEERICVHNRGLKLLNTAQPQSTSTQFNLTDMRLFHHFLTVAYPNVPFGNDEIWVSDIAALAHSYGYLVHSVLGLAASHLNMMSNTDLHADALFHRVHAMRGLNEALSTPPKIAAEGDAMLATSTALAVQTAYMGESIEEFLRMMRGCRLIQAQGWMEKLGTSFVLLSPEYQLETAVSRLEKSLQMDPCLVQIAKASLGKLKLLCETKLEETIFQNLNAVIESDSPHETCFRYCTFYEILATLPSEDFQSLVATNNATMQLLLAHCIALHVLIHPFKPGEWTCRDTRIYEFKPFRIGNIYANMKENMREYLEWPMQITGSWVGIKC